jgi:hypothetical protein
MEEKPHSKDWPVDNLVDPGQHIVSTHHNQGWLIFGKILRKKY